QLTDKKQRNEVSWLMWFPPALLAILCIVFGIFAYAVPLKHFIRPILPGFEFIGTWMSLKSTLFLFIGLGVGVLVYLTGNFKGIRETGSYVGGEEIIAQDAKISGMEFYNTVKELPLIRGFYKRAEEKAFDIYEAGKKLVFFFIGIFKYLHNGVLPTYLVWCLIGIMVFLFALVR
ncbi:MAG: hypothetical protein KKH08_06430, partial [Candidatus Omnitrophica bacterium]|nr:hypothetical protein [Candidatus Omnitrophota bacterium]